MAPGTFLMGVVAAISLAAPISPAGAVTCNNEQRLDGTLETVSIDALDTGTDSVTVSGATFAVDADTVLKDSAGTSIALGAFQSGDPARVRFCPDTVPLPTAVRIDRLTGAAANPGGILSLDVPPGTESQPVVRIFGDDPGDRLGAGTTDAIAFGDVNGDGFDDTIIGAPAADPPAGDAGGVVYVVYGGPQLAASSVDLNTDGAISQAGETRILAAMAGQSLGEAVASADVDGDGLDDIIIGAPNAGVQGPATGEVVIVYGSKALPGTVVDLARAMDKTTILGDNAQERTGSSVASADVDADGRADLIIGAPGDAPGASRQGGSVIVIHGGPALRGTTIDLNTDGAIGPAGETRILGVRAGDRTGASVAGGDIDGDGLDDILIGADHADPLATLDRGAVYVIYGGVGLRGRIIDLGANGDTVGAAGETRIFGPLANALLGASVASGDIDGDGFDDILVSATGITGPGDNFVVGEVYALYGKAGLPGTILDLSGPPGGLGETRITGREEFVRLGFSVACADITGDGLDDLLLGAPESAPPGGVGNVVTNDGVVYVFNGSAGLAAQQIIDPREFADRIVVRDNPGDLWGHSVEAGGDLDANGVPEYAASAADGDNPGIGGENSAGYVAAVFGAPPPGGIAPRIEHSIAGDAPPTHFGPVARVVIDYASGSAASTDTVELTRAAPATPPVGVVTVLPLQWRITSDRGGFTAAVTFTYTDTELGMTDEGQLVVFSSPTGAAGSWVRAGTAQTRDPARNAITVTGLDGFSLFSIAAVAGSQTPFTLTVAKTGTGRGTVTAVSNPPGIDCGNACSQALAAGSTVTLRASPDAGSSFNGWSGACDGTQDCAVLVDGDKTVVAAFSAEPPSTTTPSGAGSGGGGGGCTLNGRRGDPDPTLPVMVAISILCLLRRTRSNRAVG